MTDHIKIQTGGRGGGKTAALIERISQGTTADMPIVIPNVPYLVEYCEREGLKYHVITDLYERGEGDEDEEKKA